MQGGVTYDGSTLLSGSINVNAGGNIQPLTLEYNANGNYVVNAPSGVDGYDPINIKVNIPEVEPVLDTLIVSQNGQYRPPSGVVGYNLVDVNVITPPPVLDTLNVSQNGQYTPPEGVAGYNLVNVSVPAPVLTSKSITENGTYTPPSGVDGYNEINVNVSSTPDFYLNNQLFNYSGSRVDIPFIDNKTLQDGDRILVVFRDSVNYPTFANCFAGQMDEGLSISGTLRGGNSISGFVMNNLLRIQTLQGGSRNMYVNVIKLPDNYFNNMFT